MKTMGYCQMFNILNLQYSNQMDTIVYVIIAKDNDHGDVIGDSVLLLIITSFSLGLDFLGEILSSLGLAWKHISLYYYVFNKSREPSELVIFIG